MKSLSKIAASVVMAVSLVLAPAPAAQAAPGLPAVPASSDFSFQLPEFPALSDIPQLVQLNRMLKSMGLPGIPGVSKPVAVRPPREGGDFINVWGVNRRYLVDLPEGYNPARRYPVLIGYGGRGHSPERFRGFSRFEDTGARHAIRVYPEALNDVWEGPTFSPARPGEDVAFTEALINRISRDYSVDRSRVYAAGLSNGGGMVMTLACKVPHLFAGVVSVAGVYYNPVNRGCRGDAIPVKIMHGTLDPFRMEGGVHRGGPYISVNSLVGSYLRRNGCAPNAPAQGIPNGTRQAYACSRAETQVVLTHKAHSWHLTDNIQGEIYSFLERQHR